MRAGSCRCLCPPRRWPRLRPANKPPLALTLWVISLALLLLRFYRLPYIDHLTLNSCGECRTSTIAGKGKDRLHAIPVLENRERSGGRPLPAWSRLPILHHRARKQPQKSAPYKVAGRTGLGACRNHVTGQHKKNLLRGGRNCACSSRMLRSPLQGRLVVVCRIVLSGHAPLPAWSA